MEKKSSNWWKWTWNHIRGCSRISPGCGGGTKGERKGGCYAERQAIRLAKPGQAYEGLVKSTAAGPRWTNRVAVDPEKLMDPLRWRGPGFVFVDSMSDLFHQSVSFEVIDYTFAVMANAPDITFLVLTKRADRMAEWAAQQGPHGMNAKGAAARMRLDPMLDLRLRAKVKDTFAWPPPNVWMGVSCENKKHGLPRIEYLRRVPAALRFVSFEPLLEDLGKLNLSGIHRAIWGGETGPGARPCALEWLERGIRQCWKQGVLVHLKALGSYVVSEGREFEGEWAWKAGTTDKRGANPNNFWMLWPPQGDPKLVEQLRQWPEFPIESEEA